MILQFVADHKIILWGLLSVGIINLLQCTLFYSRLIVGMRKVTLFLLEEKTFEDLPPIVQFLDRMAASVWNRLFSITQSFLFIIAGLAGLVLL